MCPKTHLDDDDDDDDDGERNVILMGDPWGYP